MRKHTESIIFQGGTSIAKLTDIEKVAWKKKCKIWVSLRTVKFTRIILTKFILFLLTYNNKVRNLGVIMDKNLSFTNHINDMCKKATLAIRSIGRIRKYLPNDGIKRLVNALVMSRLDYSNSLLYGLPKYQIDKLQRLQNTAARLVAGTRRSDHIKPVLKDLH